MDASENLSAEVDPHSTIEESPFTGLRVLSKESDQLHVEVVGGPMDGLRGRATGPVLEVGRGRSNDLPLVLDPRVSMHHARIVKEGEHYWLEDLGSRNGTFLGDHRIHGRALIGPGTLFTVGTTWLEFMPH